MKPVSKIISSPFGNIATTMKNGALLHILHSPIDQRSYPIEPTLCPDCGVTHTERDISLVEISKVQILQDRNSAYQFFSLQ